MSQPESHQITGRDNTFANVSTYGDPTSLWPTQPALNVGDIIRWEGPDLPHARSGQLLRVAAVYPNPDGSTTTSYEAFTPESGAGDQR